MGVPAAMRPSTGSSRTSLAMGRSALEAAGRSQPPGDGRARGPGRGGGGRLLRHLHHFQRSRPVRQTAQETTLLKRRDQPVNAGFGRQIEGLLHFIERGRNAGFLYPLMNKHEQFVLFAREHRPGTLSEQTANCRKCSLGVLS